MLPLIKTRKAVKKLSPHFTKMNLLQIALHVEYILNYSIERGGVFWTVSTVA